MSKKGVSERRKRCFGDIEIYPAGDDCYGCAIQEDCGDWIIGHNDARALEELWDPDYVVWLKCSRISVFGSEDEKQAASQEFERRGDLLSRWVRDGKGNDWFARSLVKLEDQVNLLAVWMIRDGLSATTGKRPTLQAMADAFWNLMGQRKSRQQIDRLQAKLDKLEDAGGPWAAR